MVETQVVIVGGGVTGAGLARDLALRGVSCVVVEKKDLTAGASGANHGLLHGGGRYVGNDPEAAGECAQESALLKRLAPQCIEDTGSLYVAVAGDDENYIADFPTLCQRCHVPAEPVETAQALEMEPALSDQVIAAYALQDAAVDPFGLTLDNMAQACALGARLMTHTRLESLERDNGRIVRVRVRHTRTGRETVLEPQVVVNAAGAWAGQVGALAGIRFDMVYSKGSLVVSQERVSDRVIHRLRPASDADIVVPGGTVSILGTTSVRVASPDTIYPEIHEIDTIIDECARMMPSLASARYIRAYCGVRPLLAEGSRRGDRTVSRGYHLINHQACGVGNFLTITGGKLTTYRLMAEKTADRVCELLGVREPCRTHVEPLPPSEWGRWTEPGKAPRQWVKRSDPSDWILCECEMVPRTTVEELVDQIRREGEAPTLEAVGMRSRVGKGPCQGNFCSQRIAAHLYQAGVYQGREGMASLVGVLRERWRGKRPLLWGQPMVQYEFQEALYCALFSLDLETRGRDVQEAGA
ncbi:glycerol 3-phosphate dehydrogenase (quinone) subunit A [Desulfacinum hydrothermale DSM 13146]|uniref:Glycerol-3-phosphate dehydrogenase n=1 Tax=Desulfacinum hydrothermale DSM 13146 TaxID=1121390 RepID=A0A1W1XQA0_9BACT|nr:anaerobic glycerol-3-phosphate dehydrogenase subunit GlpA [Desulfacinum hydrothermale]SMC26025.1 glycerol 3-phosphate dehydrogenase (quinone) subunit A [Desulfacinum hydrothermale DSM 13146]